MDEEELDKFLTRNLKTQRQVKLAYLEKVVDGGTLKVSDRHIIT